MDENKLTISRSYIRNIRTGWILRFPSMPDTFSDSKAPNWSSQEIIGRWTPVRGFSSSGPRTVSLMITFHTGVDQGDSKSGLDVNLDVMKLRSLTYPNYNGYAYSPDPIILRIGKMVFMKCIVTSFDCNWTSPWDLDQEVTMIAEVSLVVEECSLTPLDALMVQSGYEASIYHAQDPKDNFGGF